MNSFGLGRNWVDCGQIFGSIFAVGASRTMAQCQESRCRQPVFGGAYGCGSRIGTPNGTLVSGNMDQNLRSPGGLILTHTHMGGSSFLDGPNGWLVPFGLALKPRERRTSKSDTPMLRQTHSWGIQLFSVPELRFSLPNWGFQPDLLPPNFQHSRAPQEQGT